MICNIAVPQNFNKDRIRPRIDIEFYSNKSSWLFDTGAQRTCMPEKVFRKMFPADKRPPKVNMPKETKFTDAGGNDLGYVGTFLMDMKIMGKQVQHEVVVLNRLTDSILGIEFMNKHFLSYDAYTKTFVWADHHKPWSNAIFSTTESTFIPALQTKIVKVHTLNDQCQKCSPETEAIAYISAQNPYLSNQPGLVKFDDSGNTWVRIQNCAPFDITLPRNERLGFLENCFDKPDIAEMNEEFLNTILKVSEIEQPAKLNFDQRKKRIEKEANINVPEEFKLKYLTLLTNYSELFSDTKYDLGRAKHFFHKIHLKDKEPVYRKQFKIPDAHKPFLEENVNEWLKLGVIQRSQSLYNSPVFCVPKKDGTLRIVQDFRELNKHSYMDKYSMKEINECIGDIGKAKSTIFTTLDLTSGFWQMPLSEESRHTTAFTIPGLGQFEWVTSPMGLLGCPASFQRLMEMIFLGLKNVIVYIDDLLIHSQTHNEHLQTLENTFQRLQKASMKISLKKCFFGSKEVSYLGFRLTPEGILPGKDKLKAIKKATRPKTVTEIKAFLGLCNFFRTHIKNFAKVASPLYALTRKDKNFNGVYNEEENQAFENLKQTLCSEPVMAYPRSDRNFALIVDAATGTGEVTGGLGAILTQIDDKGTFHAISYASRQTVTHEKNYSPFLLEMQAAVWGMDYFQEHLRGKRFILFTDHKPLEALSHIHTKTLNRLQLAMLDFDFEIQYKKGVEMPADFLSRATIDEICAINPFNEDLPALQLQCPQTKPIIDHLMHKSSKPSTKTISQAESCFLDQGVLWKRLQSYQSWDSQTRTVLFLPTILRRRIICEAHGKLLTGHNGIQKTKERITTSYYWPNMEQDISNHIKTCLQCQLKDKQKKQLSPLQSLPICSAPNQRVHLDLFGAIKSSSNKNNYILCMTDAFTKYAEVVALPDKEAPTVATQFFDKWICRYGVPSQIHTDGGKEFINNLSKELCEKLEIKHSKNTPYHPQCNAQVEVFNKTVQNYLSKVVNPSTLDWELYLAPLMFSYNTSFHATIKASPFQLTFGMEPRLPSFPGPEVQRKTYGEDWTSERLQILQKARLIAEQNAQKAADKSKENFDKNSTPVKFEKGQLVLINNPVFTNKNRKFSDKWVGPVPILKVISEKCVEVKFPHSKRCNIISVDRIKVFNQTFHKPDTDDDIFPQTNETEIPDILPQPKPENQNVLPQPIDTDQKHISNKPKDAKPDKLIVIRPNKLQIKQQKRLIKQEALKNLPKRITRSITKQKPDFEHSKLNSISLNKTNRVTWITIYVKIFYKQELTTEETILLKSTSKTFQNQILTGDPDEHYDVASQLNPPVFSPIVYNQTIPLIRITTDHGYNTAPSDEDTSPDTDEQENFFEFNEQQQHQEEFDNFQDLPPLENDTDSSINSPPNEDELDTTNSSTTSSIDNTILNPEPEEQFHTPKPLPTTKKHVQFQDQLPPDQHQIDMIFKEKLLPAQLDPRIRALQQEYRDPNSSTDSFHSADSTAANSGTITPIYVTRELTSEELKDYEKQRKAQEKEQKLLRKQQIEQEVIDLEAADKEAKKQEALRKKLARQGINEISTGLENFEVENPLIRPSKFTRSATAAFRQSDKLPTAWGSSSQTSKQPPS